MRKPGFQEWLVRIRIHNSWVADGVGDADEPEKFAERVHDAVEATIYGAYGHEVEVEIVESPPPRNIRRLQGYPLAAAKESQ